MERPSSWYEPDCDYDVECDSCDKLNRKLDNAKDFLEGIMEIMYSKDRFDEATFESHLDELCSYLGVPMNLGELMIRRK